MTPTNGKPKIVDADGHVLEPPDLWEEYLEPEYKGRAIRIATNEAGLEYIEIDGRPSEAGAVGTLGNVASAGKSMEWRLENSLKPGAFSYADGLKMAPGSCDSHERIKVLDGDGIDVAVLYHTVIVQTQSEWKDPDLSAAYARAYNRWIMDFCEPYPDRLIPIPHLSMLDVELAVAELQRVEGLGVRAVNIGMEAPEGRPYGGSLYDPFWAEAQESGLPVTIHPHDSVKAPGVIQGYYKITYSDTYWWHLTTAVLDMPLAVATLFQGGVFERFPGLKIVILESGCGWLPWWLDRMDEKFEIAGFTTGCKRPPSEYFKEQCWISLDPDEHFAPAVISHVGADRFIWASDYPHADGVPDPVNELRKTLEALPEDDQRKVLGENAVGLYGL